MQTWNYQLLSFDAYDYGRAADRVQKVLNDLGMVGWEIVSVTPIIGELPQGASATTALAGTTAVTVLLRRPLRE